MVTLSIREASPHVSTKVVAMVSTPSLQSGMVASDVNESLSKKLELARVYCRYSPGARNYVHASGAHDIIREVALLCRT
jgi:hypothetical protein